MLEDESRIAKFDVEKAENELDRDDGSSRWLEPACRADALLRRLLRRKKTGRNQLQSDGRLLYFYSLVITRSGRFFRGWNART